jgi:hypothetical protein
LEPLAAGQLAVELTQDVNPVTAEPTLRVDIRGEAILDERGHNELLEGIAYAVRNSELRMTAAMHAVHVEPQTVTERGLVTFDEAAATRLGGKPIADSDPPSWTFDETRKVSPTDCPDCTRGLQRDRQGRLVCAQIAGAVDIQPCHPDCIIACGLPR